MAASTLLTMALLLHGGVAVAFATETPSIVTRLMPHLPEIDPALGNLVPLGADFTDEEIHALAAHRAESAALRYSAFVDAFAYVIGCQLPGECVGLLRSSGTVPALVMWPPNGSLQTSIFSDISLNVQSRVRWKP